MKTASNLISLLSSAADPERANNLARFFKTGPGEYGEGDKFLGLKVPDVRNIIKKYYDLTFDQVEELIRNPYHEVRLGALLILVRKSKDDAKRAYEIYLRNTKWINNWDLIDLTAPQIVGGYLADKDKTVLIKLAKSKSLWERRIAMMATFQFIYHGQSEWTIKLAETLLRDSHDLIHKAVGWMLREVGKRVSKKTEVEFLDKYYKEMPRTMLRYAIERFPEKERKHYLTK